MTIKRRDFLRMGSFITVSAATLGVTGCSLDDSNDDKTAPMPPSASGSDWRFPQSVASGDPKPDSIILWTRVTPDDAAFVTGQVTRSVSIRLRVTADANNTVGTNTELQGTFVTDRMVPALSDFDGTVRHKITKLESGTTYYYQFSAGDKYSNIGRFKTAPAMSSTDPVKFAFMSCQDWNSNHWASFEDIVANHNDLDFVVHLGDYIYETEKFSPNAAESRHTALSLPKGQIIDGSKVAAYPEDYRYLYKTYRGDSRIQKMHELLPMIATWDDHEFSDDCWGDAETYTNLNQHQTARRRAANQSWYEFMPADISFDKNNPSFQNIRIYRDLKFGSVMHLVMTDERLYRADHLIPETTIKPGTSDQLGRINSRYLAPETGLKSAEQQKGPQGLGGFMADGDKYKLISILGRTQREWWQNTMKTSQAKWKIWGNEVSLLRMGLNGTNALVTLFSLSYVSKVLEVASTAFVSTPASVSAAVIAGVSTGASQSAATNAAMAIAGSAAGGGSTSDQVAAAMGTGVTQTQAMAAVGAFNNAIAVGNVVIASAIVVGTAAGIPQAVAGPAAMAVTARDADPQATPADKIAAAQAIGAANSATISNAQATFLVTAYEAAKTAKLAGATSQQQAGLAIQQTAGADIATQKSNSVFFLSAAGANASAVAAFFQKFLLNADQWDGYSAERKLLMKFLKENSIDNVVAITGDIHSFWAGQVYDDYADETEAVDLNTSAELATYSSGTPVMVDLVTAGVSSSSWFTYIKEAADILDPANALIGKLVYVPVTLPAGAVGNTDPITVNLNMLDYSMGRALSSNPTQAAAAVANQLRDQIRQMLSVKGVPEAGLDTATTGIIQGILTNPDPAIQALVAQAVGLAQQLSALGVATNPWLKHVDTDAQGYAIVEASSSAITCTFKKVNPLVLAANGLTAPSAPALNAAAETTVTLAADDPSKQLVIS